jgi:hypothetical protein
MTNTEIISTILGSSLVTGLVGWILGKRKEDIEVALKYQEFYQKHIDDLKEKISELEKKVTILIQQDEKKTLLIDEQRLNLSKWEENCIRLEGIIKEKDRQIAKLVKE